MRVVSAKDILAGEPIVREGHPVLGDHISFSSIKMFQRCPEQWRQVYILGNRQRPNLNLIHGSADHRAHALNFEHKLEHGTYLPIPDVKDAFSDTYDELITAATDTYGEILGTEKNTIGTVKDTGIRMVETYARRVTPTIEPIAVELELRIPIPDVPVPLLGYIDLEETHQIIERKTAANKTEDPSYRTQALVYAMAFKKPCRLHIVTKTKETQLLLDWQYEANEANIALAHKFLAVASQSILTTYEVFGPENPWPGAISQPQTCGWCGFKPTCYWWR